jgi:transposase-like protein
MKDISRFLKELENVEKLKDPQYWQLKGKVDVFDEKKIVTLTLEDEAEVKCGHCGSEKYVKNGRKSDLQRYVCKRCGKTFNVLTGTPLAGLRKKGRWLNFSESLKQGHSVRYAAQLVGVNKNTSFKWRHRFLKNANDVFAPAMNGSVEVKETSFKYSEKGSRVIWHPERLGTDVYVLSLVNRSRMVSTPMIECLSLESIEEKNKTHLFQDCLFISELNNVIESFADKLKLMKVPVVDSSVSRFRHVNNAKNYNANLKFWMKRFRGVATKYLHNYLSWFRELDEHKMEIPPKVILVRAKSIDRFPYRPLV